MEIPINKLEVISNLTVIYPEGYLVECSIETDGKEKKLWTQPFFEQ